VTDASVAQVPDFTRDIGEGRSKSTHPRKQRIAFNRQLDAFWCPPDELRLYGCLQPAQAFAERRSAQVQLLCRASEMPMLGDYREIFDVAQFRLVNRNSTTR
jgi:hypothetical protein